MKNKPVIFVDLGGVYFTSANREVSRRFSREIGLPQKRIVGAILGPCWKEHAEGRCDEKTYWKCVADNLDITKEQMQKLRTMLYSYPSPNDEMTNIVGRLKKKYKVAVLSSHIEGWVRFLEKKYRFHREFHEHHYSFTHGVDKPDAELFTRAARKMKVRPEDCIVIDDSKAFIDAVKKTGAKTILFKNAKQLEMQLRKMGVEI
jgi:HAD superfamily hydrolase (TIGR01509 family)